MEIALFGIFSVLAVLFGIGVILQRNVVYSALSLLAQVLCLVVLYALLHAYLIMAIQLLVYAGAIIVLFLFAIMILNPEEERGWLSSMTPGKAFFILGSGGGILAMMVVLIQGQTASYSKEVSDLTDNIRSVGMLLFKSYVFPFEIISILLLIAVVGVTYLARREPSSEETGPEGAKTP